MTINPEKPTENQKFSKNPRSFKILHLFKSKKFAKNKKFFFIAATVIIFFSTLYHFGILKNLDDKMQDIVYQSKNFIFKIDSPIASEIIIVGADEESMQAIGSWPWPRDIYAKIIDKTAAGKAAAVGIDILFTDESTPAADKALIDAIEKADNVILPSYGEIAKDNGKDIITTDGLYVEPINSPFPALKAVSINAHINTTPDPDGVVRETINQIRGENEILNSFGITVYKQYVDALNLPDNTDLFRKHESVRKTSFISYEGRTPKKFSYLSMAEVLADDFPVEYFENNIVLIGPFDEGLLDQYFTPVAKDQATYGVEIWANVIQNLMDGTNKRRDYLIDFMTIILLSLLAAYIFRRTSPIKGAAALIILNFCYLIASRWIYTQGIILSIIYFILASIVLYLSILVVRYIEEFFERKRVTDVFGRYVAPQIVNKILKEGEEGLKLGGTKKLITALFVDIRGFTPMSEKATPEQVVEILNEYLNLCASSIVDQGGTLDKFIGDATMAIFNAPFDLENHALQAVKTALGMKQGSLALEKKLEEKFGRGVKFGIGINTGDAVVGNIGCHFRMDYTAIGDTVNTAARLESNAKPGQILISEATYELVKDQIKVTPLGSIKVKGKETEIKIYEVEGLLNDSQDI